jgi:hypothetical protein
VNTYQNPELRKTEGQNSILNNLTNQQQQFIHPLSRLHKSSTYSYSWACAATQHYLYLAIEIEDKDLTFNGQPVQEDAVRIHSGAEPCCEQGTRVGTGQEEGAAMSAAGQTDAGLSLYTGFLLLLHRLGLL